MKLATVTVSVSRNAGGLFNSVRGLNKSLHERGLEVLVVGGRDEFSGVDMSHWDGINVRCLEVEGVRSFGYQPKLLETLREFNPDVVHQHNIWTYPSRAVLKISSSEGTPRVISPRGALDSWALRNSRYKKWFAARAYEDKNINGATVLHALGISEMQAIRAYGYRGPVAVIPNGTDAPPDGLVLSAPVPEWRKKICADANILLFLGRLHPKKNIAALIEAFSASRVAEGVSEQWHLCIAGWEQVGYQSELESCIDSLGGGGYIHLIGAQHDLDKVATLSHANAFVLPSLSEGLPMAVLEAWSYGLPVIMTDECNLPEGFSCGAALRISHSMAGIESGLVDFFRMSVEERREMGNNGRLLVKARFGWAKVASQMHEVYMWILGGGSPPSTVEL